jgi:Putative peptidoglycan-binding domain-containing protein
MLKKVVAALLCAMALLGALDAFAEEEPIVEITEDAPVQTYADYLYAQVTTKKGSLNMRKSAKEKSSLVTTIPNKTMIRVFETEEEWSLVVYKNKTGYVKNEFLTMVDYQAMATMVKGDKSADIQNLKKKLKTMGYYAKSYKNDKNFDAGLVGAIERFQEYNKMEATGEVTPQLYAYIMWGEAPDLSGSGNSTDPISGLTCKLSCGVSNYAKKDNGNVTMSISYKTTVSGGQEPYNVSVKVVEQGMKEANAPLASGNPFTFEWYKGSTAESFKLLLVVTDANGVSVSAVAHVALNIPYEMYVDTSDITIAEPSEGEFPPGA